LPTAATTPDAGVVDAVDLIGSLMVSSQRIESSRSRKRVPYVLITSQELPFCTFHLGQ
jgi:hypothetical protein